MTAPKFLSQTHSFHSELKTRITEYFMEVQSSSTGNYKLFVKAVVLMLGFSCVYIHLVFFTPPALIALLECVVLGGLTAAIGFNVMHDAIHGSFSKHKWVNQLAGLSLNFLGGNVFMWNTKHNVIHHAYTNIDGIDDDLDAKPFLRLCETQNRYWIHRYQHFYFWLAYSILYLYWIFFTDYKKYFTRKVGTLPLGKMKSADHISFWVFKAVHAFMFIAIPIYALGFLPWLIGFILYGMFTGFLLSMVFQLAHTVEGMSFPVPSAPANTLDDEWAIHQMKTTANFSNKSRLISWLVGGLNFQIEHHLFPKISHVHYPAISCIIRQAALDYGIPYIEYPRLHLAVVSHVMHLRQLGKK